MCYTLRCLAPSVGYYYRRLYLRAVVQSIACALFAWRQNSEATDCLDLAGVSIDDCSVGGRADLIVVMFDAHKLDISDELKMVIDTLKPHHDKMRCDP